MGIYRGNSFVTSLLAVALLLQSLTGLSAQEELPDTIEFGGQVVVFDGYPGLTARLSDPFLRYQTWDTEHTGEATFAVALEITNGTDLAITALNFTVTAFDAAGSPLYQGTAGTGPMTFQPQDGDRLEPGYTGVYDGFFTRERAFSVRFDRLEIRLTELKSASAGGPEGPVFSADAVVFEEYPGLLFQLSEPYRFLDDMSGNERFGIALKFKNDSGEPVRFMNFFVRIFDDIGPLYELETQEHNQKFDPGPASFFAADFPVDYEGVDKKFYNGDLSLFDSYARIEIVLLSVE